MQCESGLGESVERVHGVNPMVDEKYEQSMPRVLVFVVYAVCTWKPEQIVDIPVPQIVEEIAETRNPLI